MAQNAETEEATTTRSIDPPRKKDRWDKIQVGATLATPVLIALFPVISTLISNLSSAKQQTQTSRESYQVQIETKVIDAALKILSQKPTGNADDKAAHKWAVDVMQKAAEGIEPPGFLKAGGAATAASTKTTDAADKTKKIPAKAKKPAK